MHTERTIKNRHQVVLVEFKDGRQLFGIWAPWINIVSTPLFRELSDAQSVLDCGVARIVNIKKAKQSAEDVTIRLIGDDASDVVLLTTKASWSELYITGACDTGDIQSKPEEG